MRSKAEKAKQNKTKTNSDSKAKTREGYVIWVPQLDDPASQSRQIG